MGGSVGMPCCSVLLCGHARGRHRDIQLVTLGRLGRGLPVDGVQGSLQDIIFRYVESVGILASPPGHAASLTSVAFWAIFIAFAIKLAVWPFPPGYPTLFRKRRRLGRSCSRR